MPVLTIEMLPIVLLAVSAGVLGYIYAGYPLLLALLVRVRGRRHVRQEPIAPPASFVISAYNEASVIRRKIENALALDYPPGALEIVVISDASTDGTDDIVREYAARGVRLIRQSERRGKTAGLNRALPLLRGDFVVFSDANAMYERDALRMLMRNFADPEVGCVTGEARYRPDGRAAADRGERAYWDYEMRIKRLETAVGSMVGGDGAIYAIRKHLWRDLPESAINDFLNPLQIVEAGWRAVYEPEAVCHEETAGRTRKEYERRVRIVSRSWRAVFQAPGVLNPFRVGIFTWQLVSHKMLRWLSGVFAAVAGASALWVGVWLATRAPASVAGAIVLAILLLAAARVRRHEAGMLLYFAIINAASIVGVFRGTFGRVSGVWATPRQNAPARSPGMYVQAGRLFLSLSAAIAAAAATLIVLVPSPRSAAVVFWCSAGVLGYVYGGYPLVLGLWRRLAPRPTRIAPIEPSVCLLVAAHNEAEVMDAKLRNAIALDYPAHMLDIVVASDGSEDATNAIVRSFAPRVRLIDLKPRRGKMAAINHGMRTVKAEIVIFSDANTFLEPDAIRALVRNFADPRVGAVSADVALVGDRAALGRSEDLYYRYERWVQQAESDIGSMIGADGALYAIRRELFAEPPADTILDDMAIPMTVVRAGRRVVYERTARALEEGSNTAREEFARKARVLAGALQFLRRADSRVPLRTPQVVFSLLSHKALRWLSPVFATCALLSSMALAARSPFYAGAALAQGGIVALGAIGCVPRFRRSGLVAFAHYFCLVQAAAALGLVRGLTGRQSVLWRRFSRSVTDSSANASLRMQEPGVPQEVGRPR